MLAIEQAAMTEKYNRYLEKVGEVGGEISTNEKMSNIQENFSWDN